MKRFFIILAALILFTATAKAADEMAVINRVNAANATVQSLVADIQNVTHRRAIAITAEGRIHFQKPMSFRLQTTQVVPRQASADIGSNPDLFWFWIRKLNPQTMYYSKYSNLLQTNLPDSLHPLWMMDLLCVNPIETKKAKVSTQSGFIVIQEVKTNPQQKQVIKVTLVDPQRPAIVGHRVYSATGNMLAASDTTAFFKTNTGVFLPQRSETKWYSENVTIATTYSNPKVNVQIDPALFQMPKFNLPMIDIGKQRVDFNER